MGEPREKRRPGPGRRRGQAIVALLVLAGGLGAGPPARTEAAEAPLERELQGIWGQMLDALARQDIEGALAFVEPGARDRYRENFRILGPRLPAEAAALRRIRLLRLEGDRAICEILRADTGRRYPLHFLRDGAGRWWIEEM